MDRRRLAALAAGGVRSRELARPGPAAVVNQREPGLERVRDDFDGTTIDRRLSTLRRPLSEDWASLSKRPGRAEPARRRCPHLAFRRVAGGHPIAGLHRRRDNPGQHRATAFLALGRARRLLRQPEFRVPAHLPEREPGLERASASCWSKRERSGSCSWTGSLIESGQATLHARIDHGNLQFAWRPTDARIPAGRTGHRCDLHVRRGDPRLHRNHDRDHLRRRLSPGPVRALRLFRHPARST